MRHNIRGGDVDSMEGGVTSPLPTNSPLATDLPDEEDEDLAAALSEPESRMIDPDELRPQIDALRAAWNDTVFDACQRQEALAKGQDDPVWAALEHGAPPPLRKLADAAHRLFDQWREIS